ncbi:hypothetical protein SAMN02910371_01094 [Butyrivibrio sp. INlla14]|nr:hypothetical protein SAMN02910371_01094 [Butyrivibrio sp. INlla14]
MGFASGGMQNIPRDRSKHDAILPSNCKHPCSYGYGRAFCWPCTKDIVDEHRKKKELKPAPAH